MEAVDDFVNSLTLKRETRFGVSKFLINGKCASCAFVLRFVTLGLALSPAIQTTKPRNL